MNHIISSSLDKLLEYFNQRGFSGYDPYDTLNTPIPLKRFGRWVPAIAIQLQKRNPVNIRPLLGIKKGMNPKAMGLLLKSYSLLYSSTKDPAYLNRAEFLYNWLSQNYSTGYSGKCWGYNFDWANPERYLPAFTPSVVVTSFVVEGIFHYWKISGCKHAANDILSASDFVINDIPVLNFNDGISFSYTDKHNDVCYNASLLAAEILARANSIVPDNVKQGLITSAVNLILSKQKPNGVWYYSWNPLKNTERRQIDFHQGFVLVSLHNLSQLLDIKITHLNTAIRKGLAFYRENQFFDSGRAMWRLPDKWPVDIHNQSQGIITFSNLSSYGGEYKEFAFQIAKWTIENMQSQQGYFYYRITPFFKNKLDYIRWSQSWMLLALTELLHGR